MLMHRSNDKDLYCSRRLITSISMSETVSKFVILY